MARNGERLKKLEGATGGDEYHAISVVWGDEETDMVTIVEPHSAHLKTMLLKDYYEQFPDARHTTIRVVWREDDKIVRLTGEGGELEEPEELTNAGETS